MTYDSAGRRLLAAADLSHQELADLCGCSRASAANWRKGRGEPSRRFRERMAAELGIPIGAWDQGPEEAAEAPPPRPVHAPITTADLEGVETIEGVTAHIRALDVILQSDDLKTSDKIRVMGLKTAALKLRHTLEHAAEVTEDRVVRQHPKWRAIREGLMSALAPHPEARLAVVELLERLEV